MTSIDVKTHDYIQSVRVKIPYTSYITDPTLSIKQLLGQNTTIIDYSANDIITNDECYIVDVKYKSIKFSVYDIYYIKTSDVKQLMPDSNVYGFTLDGCNVKLTLPNISEFKQYIPVKIYASVPNNYSSSGQLNQTFPYFALVVRQPLNYLTTPIHYPNYKIMPFHLNCENKIYPDNYKPVLMSIDDTLTEYKNEMNQYPLFQHIDNIVIAKTYEECCIYTPTTTAYLIDFDLIPKTENIHGVIAIQPKRHPNYVLYYPTYNFDISVEELESIKSFIDAERVKLYNYNYVMNVLNK